MEGKPVTAAEYAQAYSLTPTPADKRAVTRAATAAAEAMPDISLIPARVSHLPGATGHDRTPPETLHGLAHAEDQLIKAMDKLPAERVGQLKHYMLTMAELSYELSKIVSDINARTNHKLEGWERCGYMVEELRLSPSAPWTPSCGWSHPWPR